MDRLMAPQLKWVHSHPNDALFCAQHYRPFGPELIRANVCVRHVTYRTLYLVLRRVAC